MKPVANTKSTEAALVGGVGQCISGIMSISGSFEIVPGKSFISAPLNAIPHHLKEESLK